MCDNRRTVLSSYTLGLVWILIAGVTQGIFTLPMKYTRRWKWEHVWLAYSLLAFFVLPWLTAVATVPQLGRVYAESPASALWSTALFGLGWGAGSVFFGLGVDALGMALGFSMMTGMYTALGALIPLVVLTPDLVWTASGAYILAGNVVMISGVAISAIAGEQRDKQRGAGVSDSLNPKISFGAGLAICIASGVLSGMLNFSYAFGKPIASVAVHLGATKDNSLNALWLLALPSGGILNVAYCLYLMQRRRTWGLLVRKPSVIDWGGALFMAGLWTGSVVLYGWGAADMGRLGPSLGWSLWNAIMIVSTVICGLLTHEWDGARGRPLKLLLVGIAALVMASGLLGLGGAGQ